MKKVSIIIPVYKVEPYLHRCVDSVLRQTYKNMEIILIDDGSPDNCGSICDEYARKDERILTIHKKNGGLSSARNAGIEASTGSYLTFLDSDDYWHDDYLKQMISLLEKHNADIVQCGYLSGQDNCFPHYQKKGNLKILDKYQALEDYDYLVIACAKVYRREIVEPIRFPVGRINEDDATYYRFADRAERIVITTIPYYYYFQSSDSIMRGSSDYLKEDFIPIYQERIQYFRQKNDHRLEEGSHVRFCMVLMLFYMACCKNPNNKNDKTALKNLFCNEYRIIRSTSYMTTKLRLLLMLFYFCPGISTTIANIIRG